MKKILSFYRTWLLLFPFAMYFSYYPLISLGSNGTMNYDISITLLWIVVFDILGFLILERNRRLFKFRKQWPWLLMPAYFALSIIWSHDKTRAVLILGVFLSIYFAIYSMFELRTAILTKEYKKKFFKSLFASSLVIAAWCLIQSIINLAGVPYEKIFMCPGCSYRTFGFPHPNGFAIEPQFMGNLLLVPIITSMYFAVQNKMFKRKNMLIIFAILVATLFFTLSRGAIYAFLIVAFAAVIYWFIKTKKWQVFGIWGIIALSFIFTLNLQGIMSEVSKTDDTYYSGITKVVNQLSLGKIDLGGLNAKKKSNTVDLSDPEVKRNYSGEEEEDLDSSMYDGYIEISTDERLSSWKKAFNIWKSQFNIAVFGIGFGGAPLALYEFSETNQSNNLIQNQFINTLFETGIVGFALMIFSIYLIYKSTKGMNDRVLIYLTLAAFAITLLFFSGLPNALHIYILPAMLILMLA